MATGLGANVEQPGYVLRCPNMKRSALEWVLDHEISLFGVDIPCIEASWSEDNTEIKGSLLRTLFQRDTLLLAPLVNLESISSRPGTLVCMPLDLKEPRVPLPRRVRRGVYVNQARSAESAAASTPGPTTSAYSSPVTDLMSSSSP